LIPAPVSFLGVVLLLVLSGPCSAQTASRPQSCDALITALSVDDVAGAKRAMDNGCPPNARLDGGGATPLMWAKSATMTRALLAAGAVADQRDDSGSNALSNAASRRDVESLQVLLSAGAQANTQGSRVCGPLCEAVACATPNVLVVKTLLDAGAPVNGSDCWNRTALFTVAIGGETDIMELLLSRGAQPNLYETYQGDTLLIAAAQSNRPDELTMLVRAGGKLGWANARSCATPLHAAARRGMLDAVKRLVALGADLSRTDNNGLTARGVAEKGGQLAIAQFLADVGAPSSGPIRTECVSVADMPDAAKAWSAARARTRSETCREVTGGAIGGPVQSGR
jgi:ankyrin repeat protein